MKSKVITGIVFALLLIGVSTLAFNIQPVKSDWTWTETIYIRADGSVDPDTAPISTVDNIIYTLTDNIVRDIPSSSSAIVVQKDNIVIDGAGYTLQGTEEGDGIKLWYRHNVTLKNIEIKNCWFGVFNVGSSQITIANCTVLDNKGGIYLNYCKKNIIADNNASSNDRGIAVVGSSTDNVITGNTASNNTRGIFVEYSDNNSIVGNSAFNNTYGIFTGGYHTGIQDRNTFFHNNLINNTNQVHVSVSTAHLNVWDNGFEGNYWSNYNGTDANQDGIGDTAYVIDANNTDNYPLMGMFYDFTVEIEWGQLYHVHVISNSTVSNLQVLWWLTSPNEYLQPGQKFVQFYVAGEEGSVGFCRLMIPRVVLNDSYIVLVDWQEIPSTELPISNSTHAFLYFTYQHSTHEVVIVPEFSSFVILPLFMIATLLAVIFYRRKHSM